MVISHTQVIFIKLNKKSFGKLHFIGLEPMSFNLEGYCSNPSELKMFFSQINTKIYQEVFLNPKIKFRRANFKKIDIESLNSECIVLLLLLITQRLVNLTTQLFFEMFLFLNCDKFDWIEDLKFLFEWIKCIINFEFSY